MAVTLERVIQHLETLELKYQRLHDDKPIIGLVYGMDHYRDEDGDDALRVVVELQENGEYLRVFAPRLYKVAAGPNRDAVLATLLYICWKTKIVKFEYDVRDGEVRAVVELPVEDGDVTPKQLQRALRTLVGVVDDFASSVQAAMETGEVAMMKTRRESLMELLQGALKADPDALARALAAVEGGKKGPDGDSGPSEL